MESTTEKDKYGREMPNLVYVSREKCKFTFHNYKAGALNVLVKLLYLYMIKVIQEIKYPFLVKFTYIKFACIIKLRVSAAMTNAPLVLTQDCDMFSNDPKSPLRALCYFMDPKMDPNLAFVQFPQTFHGINKDDIYSGENRDTVINNNFGMDGLLGPLYMGCGAFFRRQALFGTPVSHIPPHPSDISPHLRVVDKSMHSTEVMALAHHVAGCNYEVQTKWGLEVR